MANNEIRITEEHCGNLNPEDSFFVWYSAEKEGITSFECPKSELKKGLVLCTSMETNWGICPVSKRVAQINEKVYEEKYEIRKTDC